MQEESTLLDALQKLYPDSSKSALRSWIKNGRVTLDGLPVTIPAQKVGPKQKVALSGKKEPLSDEGINLLYHDPHIAVVEKPEGLLTVATHFTKVETLHQALKDRFPGKRVFPVHRLDQGTSGILLFALSDEAKEVLKETFAAHAITREYLAIVEGRVHEKAGTWESYLVEDKNYKVHTTDDPLVGKRAVTHFTLLKTSKKYSLLKLSLETGKKHQIRVHCKESGNPVVGDKLYGATSNPLHRLGLHAFRLVFDHPITKKKMSFTSDVPLSFQKVFRYQERDDA